MERAAVGFRIKSGWATVVLVAGPARAPRLAESGTIDLSDPKVRGARQPYHPGLDSPGPRGAKVVARLVSGVRRFARSSLARLFRRYRTAGYRLVGVGIVAGSVIDPDTIGNDHIRAHAWEGRLFRELVERAARTARLPAAVLVDKRLWKEASRVLRRPSGRLKSQVAALGDTATGPWRAEEKAAALAAWMALASRRK